MWNIRFSDFQSLARIAFAAFDLFLRQLPVRHRVEPDDANRDLAIGNRLHFKLVQIAEFANLKKGQRRVVYEPNSGCFRHEK